MGDVSRVFVKASLLWTSFGVLLLSLCSRLAYKIVYLAPPPQGGHVCHTEVDSCEFLPCPPEHNGSHCVNGVCYCDEGTCALDFFTCVAVDDSMSFTNSTEEHTLVVGSLSTNWQTYTLLSVVGLLLVICGVCGRTASGWDTFTSSLLEEDKAASPTWRRHQLVFYFVVNLTILSLGSYVVAYPAEPQVACSTPVADRCLSEGFIALRFECFQWGADHKVGWLADARLYVALVLFAVSSASVELNPCKWKRPVVLSGFHTPLELSWSLPSTGMFGVADTLQLAQFVVRLLAYDILLLFWAERDFWTAVYVLFLMVLYRSLFSLLTMPTSEHWKIKKRVICRRAYEKERNPNWGFTLVRPTNVYINLPQKFGLRCLLTFVGQVLVFCIYVRGINENSYAFFCNGIGAWQLHNFLMFLTCLIVQFLMMTMLGAHFFENLYSWYLILRARNGSIEPSRDHLEWEVLAEMAWERSDKEAVSDLDHISHPMFKVRFTMDFIANSLIYMMLLHMVPLALMYSSDGMEFAKDCCAIAFITICDDIKADARSDFWVPVPRISQSDTDGAYTELAA